MISVDITQQLGAFTLRAAFEAPGGVTAIFGRSGSGKTSLIKAISGLSRPDRGHIKIGGETLFADRTNMPVHKRRVGYVFQDARLFPHMSVLQNLRYGGTHNEAAVIDLLGLSPLLNRRPRNLSGGEIQRVAIGRALLCDPRILLLDEPLAALDAARKAEILPYLEALRDTAQIPIIYVSHAMSEVTRLATTLVVLQNGSVVASGPTADVLANPTSLALLGRHAAGAVLHGQVKSHDVDDILTIVSTAAGDVILQGLIGAVGHDLRLQVPAQDIILSLAQPKGISALNALRVTITEITKGDGPALAVGLQAGGDKLVAQISARSARQLDLALGQDIYAIFKVTAATPDLGRST